MDTLLAIKKGEKVPEIVYTGLDLVTKDNVAQTVEVGASPAPRSCVPLPLAVFASGRDDFGCWGRLLRQWE